MHKSNHILLIRHAIVEAFDAFFSKISGKRKNFVVGRVVAGEHPVSFDFILLAPRKRRNKLGSSLLKNSWLHGNFIV